jgi:predicted transcriptional regulator
VGRRIDELRPVEEVLLEILAGSELRGMSFTEIVSQASKRLNPLGRATVARYLPQMIKKGAVKKEDLGGKKIYYKLTIEAIHRRHVQRSLFSVLSMHLFDDILEGASTGKLTDEEFTKFFTGRIGALAMYTMLAGLEVAGKDPEEAGKWIEETFGTLVQKDGWRICLNRQIFGKPVPLRQPITLKEPVIPEVIVEEGTIYLKLPAPIEPGLAARVLKELPKIPDDRLKELKASLEKLYPREIEILDQALSQIKEAARISA